MEVTELEKSTMGFNRKNFVEEIVNIDFAGDLTKCSQAMGFTRKYLHSLIFTDINGGKTTLDKIYKYCRKTNRDPERYIFTKNKE